MIVIVQAPVLRKANTSYPLTTVIKALAEHQLSQSRTTWEVQLFDCILCVQSILLFSRCPRNMASGKLAPNAIRPISLRI